jgi:leukotriene-A4 hydrolase
MNNKKYTYKIVLTTILCMLFFVRCEEKNESTPIKNRIDITNLEVGDNNSYSNFNKVKIEQLHLELDIQFKSKTIYGIARYKLKKHNSDTIIFDLKNIQIQKVTIGKTGYEKNTDYISGIEDSIHGAPLSVKINNHVRFVNIYYQTTEKPNNLHWSYDSTSPKKSLLYLIPGEFYTRNWIPIQDINNHKIDFSTEIKNDLNLTPLLGSSNNLHQLDSNRFFYTSPAKTNLYDIGFFLGDFKSHKTHKNQTIYSLDNPTLSKTSKEFNHYFTDLKLTYQTFGKHPWTEHNFVILPKKFPYRSFDLPNLSFVHPVSISENQLSNDYIQEYIIQTWPRPIFNSKCEKSKQFIIGFNKYLALRIKRTIYGNELFKLEVKNQIEKNRFAYKKLNLPLIRLTNVYRTPCEDKHTYTYKERLNLQLNGFLFALNLEEKIQSNNFNQFIQKHTQQNNLLSYEDFERELNYFLIKEEILDFNANDWFTSNLPQKKYLNIESKRFEKIHKDCKLFSYQRKFSKIKKFNKATKNYTLYDWISFIQFLPTHIKKEKLVYLDYKYNFSNHSSKELKKTWLYKSISCGNLTIKPTIKEFLSMYGDIESNYQLYDYLLKSNSFKSFAIETYKELNNTLEPKSKKALEPLFQRFLK